MPRRESKFVNSYFSKPWIQPLLANFDPKKAQSIVKPGHVAQIIKVKEGCPENLTETDLDIYGSADLHDSYVRTNAVFTKDAIDEFEKYEESLSGCEFEHLPNSILILKNFHVIPQITNQLCDCNLVICIEEFSLWSNEGPTCTISSLPWARSSCSVAFHLQRLWNIAQGDRQEESGTEALTNSDLPFSRDDLSQLLAEVKKDSSILPSSHSAEGSQSTGASQSQGSAAAGPDPPEPGPSEMSSHSNNHTPEKARDSFDGKRGGDMAQGSISEGGEKDESLKWRHVHQLASWVFEIHPPSSSVSADDAGEDQMEEIVKQVTRCLEKLPDRDWLAGEDEEGSCEKDGMQGERSQDVATRQASPAIRSPLTRRKSRRGKRRSPLVKKVETLRREDWASEGQEREEKLMFEKISKQLPTTVLVTLSPHDIEPLPQDYDLDDDDYDDFPPFSDMNNNLHVQEWIGEYSEEEPQPSNAKDGQPPSISASERLADPLPSSPSREQVADLVHPTGTGQPLQNILEEIDELFDIHSEELLRDAYTEKDDVAQTPTEMGPSQIVQSSSEFLRDANVKEHNAVHAVNMMYPLHTAQNPTTSNAERDGPVVHQSHKSLEESETPEDPSIPVEDDSVIVVDQSSQSYQDDETQLPASPLPCTSGRPPVATASVNSVVKRCVMPSTSSATLSDSSQSDFVINVSGDSDFTILRCSIDDRVSKGHVADGTGDHKQHSDIDSDIGSDSDSDIFSLPVECTEVHTHITPCPEATSSEGTPELVKSHADVPVSPQTSFNDACCEALIVVDVLKSQTDNSRCGKLTETTDSRTDDMGSLDAIPENETDLAGVLKEVSRKRKERIISDDCEKRRSTEKRIRFADPEQSSVCFDESLVIDGVPFADGQRVWTSTQIDRKDAAVQETIFISSGEEDNSQRESSGRQSSSAHSSGMCLSGWISKQDMIHTKNRTVPGVKAIRESESEETEVTNTPSTNAGDSEKQTSEGSSVILLPSSVQACDSCAVDTQEINGSVKEIVPSLVSSPPSEGSASDKITDLSVTPVLFSSGESTKAVNPDGTQQQEQTATDKTVPVTNSGEVGKGEQGASFDATQHSYEDEEEPMSIDTPEDSLPFIPETIDLPVLSAEVANNVNSPDDKFTKIRSVSLPASGQCILTETQPVSSSVSNPVPSVYHSDRSPMPPRKVTQSPVQMQNVTTGQKLVQVISQEKVVKDTSNSSLGNSKTAKNSGDKQKTSHHKRVEEGASPAEHHSLMKGPNDEPKRRVTQSVLSSKIYMGSMKMRQLTINKKKKPPVTQEKPSSKSKNVLTKKKGGDAQTSPSNCSPSGENSTKGRSNVERKTMKDISMDTTVTEDVTLRDIRFTSLGESPLSDKGLSSKSRTAFQMEGSMDRSDGSLIVSSTGLGRSEGATKGRKSSDCRRKKRRDEDVERASLSPVFSLPSPDQDENLPSSLTESVLNGTNLPSTDDSSASVTGEEALLDWCAMYLLESSKR